MRPFPPRRILVPFDMTRGAHAALRTAKALARRFSAELQLAYVERLPPVFIELSASGSAPEITSQIQELRRWRGERMRRAAGVGARVRLSALSGWPPERLSRLARSRGADLVVMGTHGHTGFDRLSFGSVAEGVLRRASVPVLVVRERAAGPLPRRLLAPWNMTPYADRALLYAVRAARALGARLDVLYVAPRGAWGDGTRASVALRLRRLLGDDADRARLVVRRGEPRRIIAALARRGYDAVALSSHRRPVWRSGSFSSTAESVMRRSGRALLAVPAGGGA